MTKPALNPCATCGYMPQVNVYRYQKTWIFCPVESNICPDGTRFVVADNETEARDKWNAANPKE